VDDFDAVATSGSRLPDWLIDAASRLRVALEVIEHDLTPMLPLAASPTAQTLRQSLTSDLSFRFAVEATMESGETLETSIENGRAMCFGLPAHRSMVVARQTADETDADATLDDLAAIGSWLRGIVLGVLDEPAMGVNAEEYRIASLRRILDEAAVRGSARNVLGAFVEALGVWDDIRAAAYALRIDGRFVRYAKSTEVGPGDIVSELDGSVFVAMSGVSRVSAADAASLRLAGGAADVVMSRVRTAEGLEWVLLFWGTVDERERVRLTLYSDFLRDALEKTLATAYRRTEDRISRRTPTEPGDPIESAARQIGAQIAASIDGSPFALALALTTGRQVFAVGSADVLYAEEGSFPNRLAVTSRDDHALLTFAAVRDRSAFTVLDRHMARVAVDAARRWFVAQADVSRDYERRGRASRLDAEFEHHARDLVRSGQHVSVAVISLGADVLRPGVLSESLGRLRDQIRSCDIAGVVSPTEIAVLLPAVAQPTAEMLAERLQRLLIGSTVKSGAERPSVAVASWSPDGPVSESLVAAARTALQRAH